MPPFFRIDMQSQFTFKLDGQNCLIDGDPIHSTLASYLDRQGYGGEDRFSEPWALPAGAGVILLDEDARARPVYRGVDAGSLMLPFLAGREVWTPEGLHRAAQLKPHPVITAVAARPWIDTSWPGKANLITALFEGYYRRDLNRVGQLTDQLDSCISRTADYASMREAAMEVFAQAAEQRVQAEHRARVRGLENEVRDGQIDIFGDGYSERLTGGFPELPELTYVDRYKQRYYRPQTLVDLVKLASQYPEAVVAGGGARFLAGQRKGAPPPVSLIATDGVAELRAIVDHGNLWEIGAGVPLTAVGEVIGESCPVFGKILRRYGHRHFRNRSTLGGYLSASPADGELSPVLMALDARVRIVSVEGERDVPITQFLEAPGGQNLRPIEVFGSVLIPRFTGEVLASRGCRVRFCSAYKAAPRREAVSASITGSFAVEIDEHGAVTHAWIAFSGVGERPVRARESEAYLTGKPWAEQTILSILSMLSREVAVAEDPEAPDNLRNYRRQLVITLMQKFFYEHPRPDGPPVELGAIHDYLQPNEPFYRAKS